MYTPTNEQSSQQSLQRHTDSRLPPDLLPYGQHQSILQTQNSLKNSSSSSTGSSTSTAILDHRNQTYNNGCNSRIAYAFSDGITEHLHDDDDDDHDTQQIYLRNTIIEEPDLRIYHTDNFMKTNTKSSYSRINTPSPTTSTSMHHSNKMTTTTLPHRTKTNYELTPSSQILSTNYTNSTLYSNNKNQLNTNHSNVNNSSGINCKPRQSVVRTSPSFSFLSTGYNQQQGNFL